MRVAQIGHTPSPFRGSEPGIAWNWAVSMARRGVDVTLFAHPLHRDEVEKELSEKPIENLTIHWMTTGHFLDTWDPKVSRRGIYLHYSLFQRKALSELRKLHAQQPFDLVHHTSWGSIQQPPLVWKTGLPFIWGPIGGGQSWPLGFLEFAEQGKFPEVLRRTVLSLSRFNPSIRTAAHRADLVLAVNRETAALLKAAGAKRVELMADSGILPAWLTPASPPSPAGQLRMLYAGRCEPRKGLPLVLEAMARVNKPGVRLQVAGVGPVQNLWRERAARLGLNGRVEFLNEVNWGQMDGLFRDSDVLVFPSLRDSGGTVVLEAMSRSLPVICLDHQGVGQLVPPAAAIKIPVDDPQSVIRGFADAMNRLAEDVPARQRMAEAALQCALDSSWEKRAQVMEAYYKEVVDAHRGV